MSENAVDYLVRCTGWTTDQALVPIMTSDTEPSGTVSYSSQYNSTYAAYKAFDGNESTKWYMGINDSEYYIRYTFPKACRPDKAIVKYNIVTSTGYPISAITVKVQDSSGNNDLGQFITVAKSGETSTSYVETITLNSSISYNGYQLKMSGKTSITADGTASSALKTAIEWKEIQFYTSALCDNAVAMSAIGASDYAAETLLSDHDWCDAICNSIYKDSIINVSTPTMTSNTAPSGIVTEDSLYSSSFPAYYAFDKNSSTYTYGNYASSTTEYYIAYEFPATNKFYHAKSSFGSYSSNVSLTPVKLQCMINGAWEDIDTYDSITASVDTHTSYFNKTTNKFRLVGNRAKYSTNSQYWGALWYDIQFYGRNTGGIQTWLYAAGITDKTYTTISQVLNDSITLNTLMNSTDAVDYLVTVRSWINDICSNATAMNLIGSNNYTANTLINNIDWCTGIAASTYADSVFNIKVPAMTSNTTPSGTVSADSSTVSSYPAWQAFDGKNGTLWITSLKANAYIQYRFTTPQKIHCAFVYPYYDSNGIHVGSFYIVGSNNGSTWSSHLVDDSFANIETTGKAFIIDDDNSYTYFRLFIVTNGGNSAASISCRTVQFYGRQDI